MTTQCGYNLEIAVGLAKLHSWAFFKSMHFKYEAYDL